VVENKTGAIKKLLNAQETHRHRTTQMEYKTIKNERSGISRRKYEDVPECFLGWVKSELKYPRDARRRCRHRPQMPIKRKCLVGRKSEIRTKRDDALIQ